MKTSKNFEKSNKIENSTYIKVISDFKIPVSAQIEALNSFLSTAGLKINSEEKELIELTLNSCKTVQNLIDILLFTHKINPGGIVLEYEKFDFSQLVKEVVSDFRILLKYYNQELELKISEDIDVFADKNKIKKVLENLVLNNINSAFKNSKIIIKAIKRKSEVYFQIKTDSDYIEPYILDEVFEPVKKYSSQYSKPSVSLGLYVASEIIYSHFGTIYAKSYDNNVNIFGFSLPLETNNNKIKSEQNQLALSNFN